MDPNKAAELQDRAARRARTGDGEEHVLHRFLDYCEVEGQGEGWFVLENVRHADGTETYGRAIAGPFEAPEDVKRWAMSILDTLKPVTGDVYRIKFKPSVEKQIEQMREDRR